MKIIQKEDLQLVIACLNEKTYDKNKLDTVLERFGDDYFVGDSRQLEKTADNEEMREVRNQAHWTYLLDAPKDVPISAAIWCPACEKTTHRPNGVNYKYCPHCGARIQKGQRNERTRRF